MELDREDHELRDLVSQTLENKGVLGDIRAQLRASIFLALDDEEKLTSYLKTKNNKLTSFLESSNGRQAFTLIVELLEHFNLKHSLAVLTQEAGLAAAGVTTLRDSSDNLNDKKCVKISDANPDAVEPKLVKLLKDSTNTTPK
ncbi:hypothetical protein BOX15_Mlig006634g4 [Macrostomum lignano]|uniref:LisH domain-containing protein n=1 Tax=Macrostomum lignano TaxID=282301 RepID=A0A267GD39_9PLAT|nr:hypothetical protein BOX15_Mlig006634g4 [Macrostomum lignano]